MSNLNDGNDTYTPSYGIGGNLQGKNKKSKYNLNVSRIT